MDSEERNEPSAEAGAPAAGPDPAIYDTEHTYQRDLRSLVALAYAELPPLPASNEPIVEVPPSVREAIRMADSLIPVIPPDAPPPEIIAAAHAPVTARLARRAAVAGGIGLGIIIFIGVARLAPEAPPPPPDVARAAEALSLPVQTEEANPAPPAEAPRSEAAVKPVPAVPSSRPSPSPAIAARPAAPRPSAAPVSATAAPTTPPLMDAITDAVRRSSGGGAPAPAKPPADNR
ncbi:MAG: hypothetical protein QM820_51400 [Minicystis sp.]